MNKGFMLILKVNNYMNSIDKKLGKPINNYYYTAKYSMNTYYRYFVLRESLWRRMGFKIQYYWVLMKIIIYEYYLTLKMLLN